MNQSLSEIRRHLIVCIINSCQTMISSAAQMKKFNLHYALTLSCRIYLLVLFVFGGTDIYRFALTQTDGKSERERDLPSFGCQYHCAHSFWSVLYVTVCLSLTHTSVTKSWHTLQPSHVCPYVDLMCVSDWKWTAKIMCRSYRIATGQFLSPGNELNPLI